jgi:small GTP-binding protein
MIDPNSSVRSFRVVTIGEASVGKTSIISQLIERTFNPNISSTVGANFQQYHKRIGNDNIDLQVWDTAGQERFRALSPIYYRGAHAGVVVFSMESRDSLDSLPEQISLFLEISKDSLIFVAGNKVDLLDTRTFSKGDAEDFVREHGWQLFFTSAKTGDGVVELFDEICKQLLELKIETKHKFQPKIETESSCC